MEYDKTQKIGKSLIQFGPNNNRIYLMKLHKEDRDDILKELDAIAHEHRLGKITAKIPDWALNRFELNGYIVEANLPQFYGPKTDGYFVAKFLDPARANLLPEEEQRIRQVKKLVKVSSELLNGELPRNMMIRRLNKKDINSLVNIYEQVFAVYPFPIFEKDFIIRSMHEDQVYYGVFEDGDLVAVSSADMNPANGDAEMTDFATLPEYRGQNLSYYLLKFMMEDLESADIHVFYTIARANSVGMNKTFKRLGFKYYGTLIHNTLIGSTIENMHIWSRINRL